MNTEMRIPANPETKEMPIAAPAELDVGEAPALAPVLVAEPAEPEEPEGLEPEVAVAATPLAVTLARSVYKDADAIVTQLLDAAGVGV